MAMKIGGENRFDWVMERHWQGLAEQLDIKFGYIKQTLKKIAETLENDAVKIADRLIGEYDGEKTIKKICGIIKFRLEPFIDGGF
ncbi:MAG: hypothetical protein JRK53_25470 [Deltaproteobacteria bacterium]|nr:hypothetical protein [Deltaproteobacteria bacterium]